MLPIQEFIVKYKIQRLDANNNFMEWEKEFHIRANSLEEASIQAIHNNLTLDIYDTIIGISIEMK